MARMRAPSLSKGIILNLFLLFLIFLTGGGLYLFFSDLGIVPNATPWVSRIPYLGSKLSTPPSTAAPGTLDALEARQAAEARRTKEREFEEKLKTLRRAEEELNAERQRLTQWEEALEKKEEAIEEREKEATDREATFARLVTFYTSMRPADAARILSQQEDLVVVEIFRRMDERQASAILGSMDAQIAGTILRKMATP